MQLTLRHLRLFETLCSCGCNVTRAAEQLKMSQPAVSLAISELEEYYNVLLFDRISRRLYLTEAGKALLEYARTVNHTVDDMEQTAASWQKNGVLRVGASISIGSMILPSVVKEFAKRFPEEKVTVRIDKSAKLETALCENTLDFALIEGVVHEPTLYYEDFMEDRITLVASPDFLRGESRISADELVSRNLLMREKGSGTREIFEAILEAEGYTAPEPLWESLSTAALINAAASGIGIAVVPRRMAAKSLEDGSVKELFVDKLDLKRNYKIVYHREKRLDTCAREFISQCRSIEQK